MQSFAASHAVCIGVCIRVKMKVRIHPIDDI